MDIVEAGLYVVSDQFFVDFPDKYLRGNKEENRPHYCAIKDNKTGLYWMIPLSTKIAKYTEIRDKRLAAGKPCDILHICKLDNEKEEVFLIQDMFPIDDRYILRKYTLAGEHFCVTSEAEVARIRTKALRILSMIRRGVKLGFDQADTLKIEKALLEHKK